MSEPIEDATIRRLPDGAAYTIRITRQAPDRLSLKAVTAESDMGLEPGSLVEISACDAVYLGEVLDRPKDAVLTVAVEHFIDRRALAEINRVWKTAERD
jgi:hypothetical protein